MFGASTRLAFSNYIFIVVLIFSTIFYSSISLAQSEVQPVPAVVDTNTNAAPNDTAKENINGDKASTDKTTAKTKDTSKNKKKKSKVAAESETALETKPALDAASTESNAASAENEVVPETEAQDEQVVKPTPQPAATAKPVSLKNDNGPGSPEEALENSQFVSVSFREKPIFRIFYLNPDDMDPTAKKAQLATANLEKAMNANDPLEAQSKLVNVILKDDDILEIRVRGYKITELTAADRIAAGYKNTEEYKEQLLTELNTFTSEEFQRLQIQKFALQFFLSVFFALMGFVIFHQARMFFNRADLMIEEKRESLKPMVFLSETLISAHALGGLFTLFLVIGRVFTYAIIILTSLAAILGQFTTTRTAMSHLFSELFAQSLKNLQSLFEALPGFLLAIILLFFWNLSLKILDLFLKGVRSGRISWSFLQEHRIAVVRFWGTAISCAVFFPLVIASVFGRFNTPIEFIIISAAIILLFSTLPIFVSIACGSFVLWQGNLRLGQWIQIGDKQGEVTEISLYKMTLVPDQGGRIHIPMSHLLIRSFSEKRENHSKEFRFKLERHASLEHTLTHLQEIFAAHSFETTLTCISLSATEFHISMTIPKFPQGLKSSVLSVLSKAHDDKKITLSSDLIEEVSI